MRTILFTQLKFTVYHTEIPQKSTLQVTGIGIVYIKKMAVSHHIIISDVTTRCGSKPDKTDVFGR